LSVSDEHYSLARAPPGGSEQPDELVRRSKLDDLSGGDQLSPLC
jgi:hypothetical protein